jgi:hypothetical protein
MFNRTAIAVLAAVMLLTSMVFLVGAVAVPPGISWT